MKNNIAAVISNAISLNNKTQKQVAKELNVSISAISSYCRGTRQPDLSMLVRLQENLNIPIDLIFSNEINRSIFQLDDYELELLGAIKTLNKDNKELFIKYTKDLLQILKSSEK